MKTRPNALILGLLALVLVLQAPAARATYSLIWSDEFDGTTLDTSNWTIDTGNGCPDLCGWGNAELEFYRPQNVAVADGNLVLTAKAESFAGYDYTSGKVHTRDKQAFLYGRMEMRAKLPTGGGMWPAFWMMPQDDVYGGWAASGEIDIMESANGTTTVGGALHYGGSFPNNTSTSGSYNLGGANFADSFHIYAVEWEEDQIRWYVDDTLFAIRFSSQWYSDGAPGNPLAPFDQEFYLILNAAVGGYYTGCTEPWCITADFPQEYLIDYVRVYEDIENEAPTVLITTPTEADNPQPGSITITAEAADADGSIATVEFYNGTTLLGADTTAPYIFTWTGVTDGCYAVIARAIDNLGGFATDTVELTVGTGCGQEPFLGSPFVLPTLIQAEDFDVGGPGVAYRDIDPGNTGTAYRLDEDVDIENCSDTGGGYNLGWVNAGEWLEYTVEVPVAGQYIVETRVASVMGGGKFHLEFNGVDKTSEVLVPSTTGWQTWETISNTVSLDAGLQVMRLAVTSSGFNINYLDISRDVASDVPASQLAGFALHPCYPNPFNPSTTISYELGATENVSLVIHDVAGKVIQTLLAAQPTGPGRHAVLWDGRDSSGHTVAAGVYFYRLRAGDFTQTRSMVLVK